MAMTQTHPFDTALELEDGAAAITATEVNSGGEIDIGAGLVIGGVVINVTACKVSAGDESYKVELQGTNTTGFGSADDNVILASRDFGAHETTGATAGDTGVDMGTGTYYVPFTNDVAGTVYRYVRLKVTTAGTSETITYTAFLTQARTMGS